MVLIASGCTGDGRPPAASPSGPGSGAEARPPTPSSPDPLCRHPGTATPDPRPASPATGDIAAIAQQVEQVRGLRFREPVSPEPMSRTEIGLLVRGSVDSQFPAEMMERRGRAWATMGVIPAGTDLYRSIADFGTSQTIGFYDTSTRRLVYVSADPPSPLHRLTLAHELTHALDDQHFGLGLVDELTRTCQDERMEALVGLAEGNAVEMSLRWAQANLSAGELVELGLEVGADPGPPATVPLFVREMFLSPYLNGQAFVRSLLLRGGQPALDDAFRDPPRSTEQILHPEKFGVDEPQLVEAPDLEEALGTGWVDLDVQDVGEGWLLRLLGLDLPASDARDAAAGWDGGQYRAWAGGSGTAVLLDTVWDSAEDATEFADAAEVWAQDRAVSVIPRGTTGTTVRVAFASDGAVLQSVEAALAGV